MPSVIWTGGVRALYGEGAAEVPDWLRVLVEAETIVQSRESRFPDDTEYVFRHALLREAAYSLLTDEDRERGHRLASLHLEKAGEADPAVIAEHAQRGDDAERAVHFYTRAAEQCWERNDLDQLLVCAERGIGCGASGEALGLLQALSCMGQFGTLNLVSAESAGTKAIDLLPRGSIWWCRALACLAWVLPQLRQPERRLELLDVLLKTEPAPNAETAYFVANGYQLAMNAWGGVRPATETMLHLFRTPRARAILERDTLARAYVKWGEGWHLHLLAADPFLFLSVADECDRAFKATETRYNRAMPAMLLGAAQADLGDFDSAERTLRDGLALSVELRDSFLMINMKYNLAMVLSTQSEPASLEEARRLATEMIDASAGPAYEGVALVLIASDTLRRGELKSAEELARKAHELCAMTLAPCAPGAAAILIDSLREQGCTGEACSIAEQELQRITALGGVGFTEIPFRVAAVEALHAAGDHDAANAALRTTLKRIELRAQTIADPVLRDRYRSARPENARAFALAQTRLGMG